MRAGRFLGVGKSALYRATHGLSCDENCRDQCAAKETRIRKTLLPIFGETPRNRMLRVAMRSPAFGHFLETLEQGKQVDGICEELDGYRALCGWTAKGFERLLHRGTAPDGEEIDPAEYEHLLSVYFGYYLGDNPDENWSEDDWPRHECLRALAWPKSPGTYYVRLPSRPGLLKIGTSHVSIAARLSDQGRHAGIPEPYELLAWEDDPKAERRRHVQFQNLRLPHKTGTGREWFRFEGSLKAFVLSIHAGLLHS